MSQYRYAEDIAQGERLQIEFHRTSDVSVRLTLNRSLAYAPGSLNLILGVRAPGNCCCDYRMIPYNPLAALLRGVTPCFRVFD